MERRSAERCPVCQGPTKKDEAGRIRCRNSLCSFNHEHVTCPRCGSVGASEARNYQDGKFFYACRDCQNNFSLPES